jgi:hypothetical protein
VYQDYRGIANLNNGQIPHKILYEFEDYYEILEDRSKVEVNPVFSNRIFMKEVYAGGFIVSDLYILIRLKYRDHSKYFFEIFGLSYKVKYICL